MPRSFAFAALALGCSFAFAQTSAPLSTHQVNPDNTITFRYTGAAATKVSLSTDAYPKPLPMTRDDAGLWSVTTPPLPSEIYGYSFVVDGHRALDPSNPTLRHNLLSTVNDVLLPEHPAAPWELTGIPHGRVDHYRYTSHVVKNLPENQNAYIVYTPPGYDQHRKGGYPVLYLLHGWSDDETGWTQVGHADLIFDAMIEQGAAVPMIVVMPLGYGDLDFVTHSFSSWNDAGKVDANTSLFTQAFETEIMPAIERDYNTAPGRENRAIAGLSMGGLESLSIGLNHADQFAYVVGLSSALFHEQFDEHFPNLDAKKANLRLLWVACGVTDTLIKPNREFIAWATAKGLTVTPIETPGAHTWLTWRDNLTHFAPLLFKATK